MDSVTQKNNLLSMTGIDQTEENTIAIVDLEIKTEDLETKTTENTYDITTLENIIQNFVQNDAPYIVYKKNIDQTIDGVKTFLKPLYVDGFQQIAQSFLGGTIYQPIKFCSGGKNNMSFSSEDGLWVNGITEFNKNVFFNPQTKYSTGKCTMTFDVNYGLNVVAPITLLPNALKISNISGLQDALNLATDVPDRSVTSLKIALNTILGENLNNAISFSTTGDIGAIGATFASCNSIICQAGIYRFQDTNPLLNVSIPCIPKPNASNPAMYDFLFYNTDFVSDYAHPVNFYIHSLTVLSPRKPLGTWIERKMDLLFSVTTFIYGAGYDVFKQTEKISLMIDVDTFKLKNPIQIKTGYYNRFGITSTNNIGDILNIKMIIHGYQY